MKWAYPYVAEVLLSNGSVDALGHSVKTLEDVLFLEFMYAYPGALVRHGEGAKMWHLLVHGLMSGKDFQFYGKERKRKWYKMQRHVGKEKAEERLKHNDQIVTALINREASKRRLVKRQQQKGEEMEEGL